jgi:hypothetical protein
MWVVDPDIVPQTKIQQTVCYMFDHRSLNQDYIKQILNSGLFWAVRAAEKKNVQTAVSMLLLRSVFLCFHGQKNVLTVF